MTLPDADRAAGPTARVPMSAAAEPTAVGPLPVRVNGARPARPIVRAAEVMISRHEVRVVADETLDRRDPIAPDRAMNRRGDRAGAGRHLYFLLLSATSCGSPKHSSASSMSSMPTCAR